MIVMNNCDGVVKSHCAVLSLIPGLFDYDYYCSSKPIRKLFNRDRWFLIGRAQTELNCAGPSALIWFHQGEHVQELSMERQSQDPLKRPARYEEYRNLLCQILNDCRSLTTREMELDEYDLNIPCIEIR